MAVSVKITLDTRHIRQGDPTYPVKLLVTFDRNPQRYQTVHKLTIAEFQNLSAKRVSAQLQTIRAELNRIKWEAEKAIGDMRIFSFSQFERNYLFNNPDFVQRKRIKQSVTTPIVKQTEEFDYTPYLKRFSILSEDYEPETFGFSMKIYIQKLIRKKRISTASSHHCCYRSMIKFQGNLPLVQVNEDYLRAYEVWMLAQGNSKTTVGIYLRALRTIFNEADAAKILDKRENYPFGKRQFIIPTGKGTKKTYSIQEIELIFNYTPTAPNEEKARDYWLFLYQGNGMNPKDLAHLRFGDYKDDFIRFERQKTEWASRGQTQIDVYVTENMKATIQKWGNLNRSPNDYIFPILEQDMDPLTEYDRVQRLIEFIGRNMAVVTNNLGIKNGAAMEARHSFASVMKRSGGSTEFIQESLGHSDIKTTENYLASFEDDFRRKQAGKLRQRKKRLGK